MSTKNYICYEQKPFYHLQKIKLPEREVVNIQFFRKKGKSKTKGAKKFLLGQTAKKSLRFVYLLILLYCRFITLKAIVLIEFLTNHVYKTINYIYTILCTLHVI